MADYYLGPNGKESIVFRNPSTSNEGVFLLNKSIFLVEGVNHPVVGRCDNLTYTAVYPTYNTDYHDEAITLGVEGKSFAVSNPAVNSVFLWFKVIDIPGKLCIVFDQIVKTIDDNKVYDDRLENGMNPGALWSAGSLIELVKIMSEWAEMTKSPFNLDHPMAIYSKMFFDEINPPKKIMDEIKSLPDMHLARFLQGDSKHRKRVENFPDMSEDFKSWLEEIIEMYHPKTFRELVSELVL